MASYVVFLRAVNVGKRQVKMAQLREWLEAAGYADVATHIQTGNVRVSTSSRSAKKVGTDLERLLRDKTGFDVPCMVFTQAELRQVVEDADAIEPPPFAGAAEERRFVVFFKDPPTAEHVTACAAYDDELERAWVIGRAAHVWIGRKFMDAQIFGKLRELFDPGTNRNLTVVRTLVDKWC
jgi:uncharacterized protein (DUF1697 family)